MRPQRAARTRDSGGNVIIEAFRTRCWNAITTHFSIQTVTKYCEEALTGDPLQPDCVIVDAAPELTGGAGYLEQLASDLGLWAKAAQDRLFNHDCERACYRCLKSARNQFDHALLDKERVRSVLFQFAQVQPTEAPRFGRAGDGRNATINWLDQLNLERSSPETANTAIEKALLQAIRDGGRLPEPKPQYEIADEDGRQLTVPDFTYPDQRIAIYCDGFAYHGDRETLESDARKRNILQTMGWAVLTFWGRQILRNPGACEEQIWQCYQFC